jgi:hypothetical protein
VPDEWYHQRVYISVLGSEGWLQRLSAQWRRATFQIDVRNWGDKLRPVTSTTQTKQCGRRSLRWWWRMSGTCLSADDIRVATMTKTSERKIIFEEMSRGCLQHHVRSASAPLSCPWMSRWTIWLYSPMAKGILPLPPFGDIWSNHTSRNVNGWIPEVYWNQLIGRWQLDSFLLQIAIAQPIDLTVSKMHHRRSRIVTQSAIMTKSCLSERFIDSDDYTRVPESLHMNDKTMIYRFAVLICELYFPVFQCPFILTSTAEIGTEEQALHTSYHNTFASICLHSSVQTFRCLKTHSFTGGSTVTSDWRSSCTSGCSSGHIPLQVRGRGGAWRGVAGAGAGWLSKRLCPTGDSPIEECLLFRVTECHEFE